MKFTSITPQLFEYLEQNSLLAHPILERVAQETSRLPDSIMQIPKHQGGFMHLLVKLLNVKEALEVGCYTGYSAIAVASALPADGKLTTFDVEKKYTDIAQNYFAAAKLSPKINVVLGPAASTLKSYIQERGTGFADFAFVDADKANYKIYYELTLQALRPNGLLILDNAFRDGDVLDPEIKDIGTTAVQDLTKEILTDSRVDSTMIPMADGLILVRKK